MFDEAKAQRAMQFINCLKHTKGKWRGQPFDLLPWQEQIIRDVFGTVKENGYRQYNTAYVEIPKKNGKSELAAGVALYMTCGDGEWGAEVYGCASDRKGSGDARTQPLFFLITTAGTDRHSVCFEQHQKAEDILCGRKIDPTFYPVIYGASDDADWTSEKVWYGANPSLGHTIDIEKVRNACLSAKDNPAEENIFRQLRLNQWVKQSTRWMQMEKWDACAFPVDERELLGRECYGGLDLSSSIDITAFVLVFPPRNDTEKYIILPYFWIPEENMIQRVRRDHVPYDVWEKQGCLMTTEGNVIHYGFIENFIDALGKKFLIKEIAFDRWGAVQMVQNLEGLGFTVVPFGQGFKDMSPPSKRLMELTLEKNLAHGGHPVLRWMMDNIFIRTDPAGNIKPDKEKSMEKIDGAVATIMALDRAIRYGGSTGSVYDERGILSF